MTKKDYYTTKEICQLLGCSRQWFHFRFTSRGEGPPRVVLEIGLKRRIYFPISTADPWLANQWLKADAKAAKRGASRHTTHQQHTQAHISQQRSI